MGNRRDPNARWWLMMEQFQKNSLEWAIEYCGGVNKAAKYLGLNHGYVYRLAKKLGVSASIRDYNKKVAAEEAAEVAAAEVAEDAAGVAAEAAAEATADTAADVAAVEHSEDDGFFRAPSDEEARLDAAIAAEMAEDEFDDDEYAAK